MWIADISFLRSWNDYIFAEQLKKNKPLTPAPCVLHPILRYANVCIDKPGPNLSPLERKKK